MNVLTAGCGCGWESEVRGDADSLVLQQAAMVLGEQHLKEGCSAGEWAAVSYLHGREDDGPVSMGPGYREFERDHDAVCGAGCDCETGVR